MNDGFGKDGASVFASFSFADDDGVGLKVQILNAKAKGFEEAESGSVEEIGDEERGPFEMGEDEFGFRGGEDDGDADGAVGAGDVGEMIQRSEKDILIQKEESVECLVLCGGGDIFLHGEMREKLFGVGLTEAERVLRVMIDDVAADPIEIRLFRALAVVADAHGGADFFQELGLLHRSFLEGVYENEWSCGSTGIRYFIVTRPLKYYLSMVISSEAPPEGMPLAKGASEKSQT